MTIKSFTDTSKSYEVTDTSCSCKAFEFGHGRPCKHLIAVEAAKAVTFIELKRLYDVRSQAQREARRMNFLNWELSMGL